MSERPSDYESPPSAQDELHTLLGFHLVEQVRAGVYRSYCRAARDKALLGRAAQVLAVSADAKKTQRLIEVLLWAGTERNEHPLLPVLESTPEGHPEQLTLYRVEPDTLVPIPESAIVVTSFLENGEPIADDDFTQAQVRLLLRHVYERTGFPESA